MAENKKDSNRYKGKDKPLIFYRCYGSAHSSIVSAAIHIGMLPEDKIPSPDVFMEVPFFDKTPNQMIGTPIFFGRDEMGFDIYVIGMGNDKEHAEKMIYRILSTYGISREKILFIDTLHRVGIPTRVGGFLSRKMEIISLGRPLVIWSIRQNYKNFVSLVKMVKKELKRSYNI